jgi:hypothetical protein
VDTLKAGVDELADGRKIALLSQESSGIAKQIRHHEKAGGSKTANLQD